MTLKICYLNVWALNKRTALIGFLMSKYCQDVDIFCFQEVMHTPTAGLMAQCYQNEWRQQLNSRSLLEILFDETHDGFFQANSTTDVRRCTKTGDVFHDIEFGNMMFIRKGISIRGQDTPVIFKGDSAKKIAQRKMQVAGVEKNGVPYLVGNVHGLWIEGNTKGYAPERTTQSASILTGVERAAAECGAEKIIFGGDFNYDMMIEPVRMLERGSTAGNGGYQNVVRDRGVKNTRTQLFRSYNEPGVSLYADYVFAGYNVEVVKFAVLNSELVSDHAPLIVTVM